MRRPILIALFLLIGLGAEAQSRFLSFCDHLISDTRIGAVGKKRPVTPPELLPGTPWLPDGTRPVSRDYDFVLYLLDGGMKDDASAFLHGTAHSHSDTLHFLRAWTEFNLRQIEAASADFSLVGAGSPFHEKSLFYNVVSLAHLGRYGDGVAILDSYSGPQRELASFQRAGLSILLGDKDAYHSAAELFTYSSLALAEQEKKFDSIAAARFDGPSKSPALAAVYSALVPGLGKIYAGRTGEGVSSLLAIGTLGAFTAENWVREGARNWKTILFGTLCATFYVADIYGSYCTVQLVNNERLEEQNTAVLLGIHIPLRTLFP